MAVPEDEESLLPSSHSYPGGLKKGGGHGKASDNSGQQDPGKAVLTALIMVLVFLCGLIYYLFLYSPHGGHALPTASPCDTVSQGYQCATAISHSWGQYSPYYLVPSEHSDSLPSSCQVIFAHLLSRHGARSPTTYKAGVYNETLVRLRSGAHNLTGPYAFLGDYDYDLGTEELTLMGEQELIHSGIDFFTRYEALATADTPFIRAGDQNRVVESARKWAEGFHKAKVASGAIKNLDYPYGIIEISEAEGMNNTLNHGLCAAFEANKTGLAAQAEFGATFLPEISARLKRDIGTSDLTDTDTLSLMDLCPYTVVAETSFSSSSIRGVKRSISGANPQANPFCALFNLPEWESYDYYQSLGKYYGYGAGSDLGPTQGVGFVNELIARLTSKSVQDSTSVNHTLDSNPKMFPLGKSLYADFSHDNDMTAVFFALGLFEGMPQLRKDRIMSVEEMEGYTASRTVPFGGRMVVEKMTCEGEKEEMIRVIMNGKVMPLVSCSGDEFGRCGLGAFVESLGFAKGGGRWDDCFTESVRTTTIRKPGLDETALASAL